MTQQIIAQELLDILACPACKESVTLLEYKTGTHGLKCEPCKKIYPIKDGIPVMLIDKSLPLTENI